MTREEAINTISVHYPPDSDCEATRWIGQDILEEAKREISSWRNEPTAVLVRMAELCVELDESC